MKIIFIILVGTVFNVTALTQHVPDYLVFDESSVTNEIEFYKRLKDLQLASSASTEQFLLRGNEFDVNKHQTSLFEEFISLFQRSYVDDYEEHKHRFRIFQNSLGRHAYLNQIERQQNGTALYGINKFSDWSSEEFKSLLVEQKRFLKVNSTKPISAPSVLNTYDGCGLNPTKYAQSMDWRRTTTRIKNQKDCGSCWAFVASEQVETYWAISGKSLVELSPQEILSCVPSLGCSGGNTCSSLRWLINNGYVLVSEDEYPYEAKETKCRYENMNHTNKPYIKELCGCSSLAGFEKVMLLAMSQKGPLAVNVDAVSWHDYVSGVVQHHCTARYMNHAVQLVAYNLEDGPVPYWVARNQWGRSFGENGYIRIKYGENICGVAQEPSFVVV